MERHTARQRGTDLLCELPRGAERLGGGSAASSVERHIVIIIVFTRASL